MKKFKLDISDIMAIIMEVLLVIDIVLALGKQSVSVGAYICAIVIAMMYVAMYAMERRRNKKK